MLARLRLVFFSSKKPDEIGIGFLDRGGILDGIVSRRFTMNVGLRFANPTYKD